MAMASKEPFGGNYLLLKPEVASLLDLGRLLFSSKSEKRRFIENPEPEVLEYNEFQRRWLIFISVLLQKALLISAKSMNRIGYIVEMWLNLLSSNNGLINLLLSILKGKMVKPERSSARFTSVVGNLDPRVDLDKNIKHEDANYKGFLSIMAAKLSYENAAFAETTVKNQWNVRLLSWCAADYEEVASTKSIVVQDPRSEPNLIVVAFRGTDPFNAEQWRTDVDISWYELAHVGKIHGGFMKALGLQKNRGWPKEIEEHHHQYAYYAIRRMLREIFHKNEKAKFILTGHSLGGALAILFAAVLALHEDAWLLDKLEGVYTFGQPRVGDQQFGDFMKEKLRKDNVRYMRFVYCNDMVPRIPYDDKTLLFKHFGPCLYYNSLYQGQVLEEEPNKNYFNLFWATPKNLNALWELIRSFIIGFFGGHDYKESWFMTLLRLVGLVIPGLAAHCPCDYVNLTRLGPLHAPPELQNLSESKVD
ncbi:hypothetical protein L6164_015452 [Bauhinia variegata]|uniref:Uncharacterized protein n=1 Tax=Bauhinia variegata TaxID=167791 RepID=A0ACB9NKK3_BAUVA|nr:hypothetical protein L6164_015452 [Bauhinia variegata]